MFITTIIALSTLASDETSGGARCQADAPTIVRSDDKVLKKMVSPCAEDIRRVWALFLADQKKKASATNEKARIDTRLEEFVAAVKELEESPDDNRAAELQKRIAVLIQNLQGDLGIGAAPENEPSPKSVLAEISEILATREFHRPEGRRISALLADLKSLLAAREKPQKDVQNADKAFKVIFLSSLAQTAARKDDADPASSRPSGIKDFQRYFTEMFDIYEAANDKDNPLPTEVKEAMRRLKMSPRIVAQLLPSVVLDGKASVVDPAAQVQWRTRYQRSPLFGLFGFTWNTDGGIGYGPAVVVFDPSPVLKTSLVETITTTVDANGVPTQTRTQTLPAFTCTFVTKVVGGQNKEVCVPPAAGKPALGLQNAFQWHLGLQAGGGFARGHRVGEWRVFGRAQMSNPTTSFKIVEDPATKGAGSTALASIDGEARWAFETGLRLALYDRERQEARERSGLRPAMSLAFGFRWDKRLSATNLESAGLANTGSNPERRHFLRLALTKIPVFQDNGDFFNLTVGIDREWAGFFGHNSSSLPGVTRLFIQANIDFLRNFSKQ